MKNIKNKTKISTIALILVLTIAYAIVIIPAATAQEIRVNSWPYCNVMPNPQQVNRPVLIHVGSEWPTVGRQYLWENLTVEVTKPDNTIEILGPYTTDSTGGTGVPYTPNKSGIYRLQTHFPQQTAPVSVGFFQAGPPSNAIMIASDSPVIELVVQEEPIAVWPATPLPGLGSVKKR